MLPVLECWQGSVRLTMYIATMHHGTRFSMFGCAHLIEYGRGATVDLRTTADLMRSSIRCAIIKRQLLVAILES